MKLIKTYLIFFFFFASCTALADSSFQQLDSFLSTFKSMSANFSQTAIVRKGVGKKSSGTMALQRPGKFRWETTSPNRQVIIADGKYLWFYDVDLEQATKHSLTKDAHSPAILLSGTTAALEQRFTMIDAKTEGSKTIFRLKPKQDRDMFQEVVLQFAGKKLSQMAVVDNLGQKTIFSFSNVVLNPKLSSALFQFRAPKGVDVIKE